MSRRMAVLAMAGMTLCCRQPPPSEVETQGASASPASPATIFTDGTAETGLRFTTRTGAQGGYHMP